MLGWRFMAMQLAKVRFYVAKHSSWLVESLAENNSGLRLGGFFKQLFFFASFPYDLNTTANHNDGYRKSNQ